MFKNNYFDAFLNTDIAGALPHLALEPWNPRNFGIRNLKDYPSILVW